MKKQQDRNYLTEEDKLKLENCFKQLEVQLGLNTDFWRNFLKVGWKKPQQQEKRFNI